jgi:hypothetical protein
MFGVGAVPLAWTLVALTAATVATSLYQRRAARNRDTLPSPAVSPGVAGAPGGQSERGPTMAA